MLFLAAVKGLGPPWKIPKGLFCFVKKGHE